MIRVAANSNSGSIDSSRAQFINGQVLGGNLKPKRTRSKIEIFRRLQARVEINRLIAEHPTTENEEYLEGRL